MTAALSRPVMVLRVWLALMALLLPLTLSGALQSLEQALAREMARRPLPPAYFLVFIVLGALLPLLVRWLQRRRLAVVRTLNPYLLLLLGQIVCELVLVKLGGKGLGVLVGLLFSLVRVLQLAQLWPLAADLVWLRALLGLLGVLWSFNIAQMLVQRWWPLLG